MDSRSGVQEGAHEDVQTGDGGLPRQVSLTTISKLCHMTPVTTHGFLPRCPGHTFSVDHRIRSALATSLRWQAEYTDTWTYSAHYLKV